MARTVVFGKEIGIESKSMTPFRYLSDSESILLVLVCLYLWECFVWIPEGAVCFVSICGDFGKSIWFGTLLRNDLGGGVLVSPLPTGRAMLCCQWPISLSTEGIYSYVSQAFISRQRPRQVETFWRFSDIRSVEAKDRDVLVNGQVFFRSHSTSYTEFLVRELRRVLSASTEDRPVIIHGILATILDRKASVARLEKFRVATRGLGHVCSWFFLYTFAVGPALMYSMGLFPYQRVLVLAYLLGFLGFWALSAVSFRKAHRTLFPKEHANRRRLLMGMLFCPMKAVRAVDVLARDLVADFTPLAVARAWCDMPGSREFAGKVLRDLRCPMQPVCPSRSEELERTEQWFRRTLQESAEEQIRVSGEDLTDLLRPPVPDNPRVASYCPRCHDQFEIRNGTCPGCGGVPLVHLEWGERAAARTDGPVPPGQSDL